MRLAVASLLAQLAARVCNGEDISLAAVALALQASNRFLAISRALSIRAARSLAGRPLCGAKARIRAALSIITVDGEVCLVESKPPSVCSRSACSNNR